MTMVWNCVLVFFFLFFFLSQLVIDGLRFDDKLFSANKFTSASALSCPLGKSLFSNLIGYACNLYPFFISLTFFHTLYMSLDSNTSLLQNSVQWDQSNQSWRSCLWRYWHRLLGKKRYGSVKVMFSWFSGADFCSLKSGSNIESKNIFIKWLSP